MPQPPQQSLPFEDVKLSEDETMVFEVGQGAINFCKPYVSSEHTAHGCVTSRERSISVRSCYQGTVYRNPARVGGWLAKPAIRSTPIYTTQTARPWTFVKLLLRGSPIVAGSKEQPEHTRLCARVTKQTRLGFKCTTWNLLHTTIFTVRLPFRLLS